MSTKDLLLYFHASNQDIAIEALIKSAKVNKGVSIRKNLSEKNLYLYYKHQKFENHLFS